MLAYQGAALGTVLAAALLWQPETAFLLPWISLWGLALCDRRVKTSPAPRPVLRPYQTVNMGLFWASLAWLVAL